MPRLFDEGGTGNWNLGRAGEPGFHAAWQIRRLEGFGLAVAAVVLASLQPGVWPLTASLGLIVVAILCQKPVREAFTAQRHLRTVRGGNELDSRAGYRLALVSTALVILSLAVAPITSLLVPLPRGISGAAVLSVAVLCWFPIFGAPLSVMLGWLALFAMRRPTASARGLGYAVFGVLFAPMQQVVRWFGPAPATPWVQSNLMPGWTLGNSLLAILASGLLASWISRRHALSKSRGPVLKLMHRLIWTMGIIDLAYSGALVFGLVGRVSYRLDTAKATSTNFYLNHRHLRTQPEGEGRTFAGHLALGTLGVQVVSDPVGLEWSCWLADGTAWCPQGDVAALRRMSRLNQPREAFHLFPIGEPKMGP
jgi:hypothetical protein